MEYPILREALSEFLGPFVQFFTNLCGENGEVWWREFKKFLRKEVYWQSNEGEHIVDCDAMPEILSDWQKEEHRKMGKVKLEKRDGKLYANGQEVVRHLSKNQKNGIMIGGHKLRQELVDMKGKIFLNACILDYLLKHPELIPEEWKKGVTYFWGTIFRRSDGSLFVADLRWFGGGWGWDDRWLDYAWGDDEPAACLAK